MTGSMVTSAYKHEMLTSAAFWTTCLCARTLQVYTYSIGGTGNNIFEVTQYETGQQ